MAAKARATEWTVRDLDMGLVDIRIRVENDGDGDTVKISQGIGNVWLGVDDVSALIDAIQDAAKARAATK